MTYAAIGDEAALTHRLVGARHRVRNAPMTVELHAQVPSANGLYVWPECPSGNFTPPASAVGDTSLEIRGCDGEATFDLLIVEIVSGANLGRRKLFEDVAFQAGTTLTLAIDEGDLLPPSPDHVFSVSGGYDLQAFVHGLDGAGNLRSISMTGEATMAPVALASPSADGVDSFVVTEVASAATSAVRTRTLSSVPASNTWTPPLTAAATSIVAKDVGPSQPEVSWTLAGVPSGDAIVVQWMRQLEPGTYAEWMLWVPPGTTSAPYPALPSAMSMLVPGKDSLITVRVVEALDTGAGRRDLFHDPTADQTWIGGPFLGYPLR